MRWLDDARKLITYIHTYSKSDVLGNKLYGAIPTIAHLKGLVDKLAQPFELERGHLEGEAAAGTINSVHLIPHEKRVDHDQGDPVNNSGCHPHPHKTLAPPFFPAKANESAKTWSENTQRQSTCARARAFFIDAAIGRGVLYTPAPYNTRLVFNLLIEIEKSPVPFQRPDEDSPQHQRPIYSAPLNLNSMVIFSGTGAFAGTGLPSDHRVLTEKQKCYTADTSLETQRANSRRHIGPCWKRPRDPCWTNQQYNARNKNEKLTSTSKCMSLEKGISHQRSLWPVWLV